MHATLHFHGSTSKGQINASLELKSGTQTQTQLPNTAGRAAFKHTAKVPLDATRQQAPGASRFYCAR